MANTYNLFISHSWAYSDAYEKLIKLLDNRGNFPYKPIIWLRSRCN